jgi:hypothetical protein
LPTLRKEGEVGMTNKEAIDTIKHAIAEVEWTYPMDYAAAFDKAVEALELLREQEALKQKMWNALYAEEDKLEKKFVGTDKHNDWFTVYRPFLQRGFEIAIEVIAAHEEGR